MVDELPFYWAWPCNSFIISRLGLASRLWLLSAATLVSSPIAAATLNLQPPAAMAALVCYYLFAETWSDFFIFAMRKRKVFPIIGLQSSSL